ncbi:Cullin family-domain-containing protein [Limtongia smithiae]|uniref:Cullin family-domain-containing protein n=1 Tax=Limtongia smithiae TaxID=1125753 RepID=UPI0034CD4E05
MLQNFPSKGIPLSIESTGFSGKSTSRVTSAQRPKRQRESSGSGIRKLVVASEFGSVSAALSDKYFATTWNLLNSALDSVFKNEPVNTSFEGLYRGVENLCRADKSTSVWDNLKMRITGHIKNDFLQGELLPAAKRILAQGETSTSANNMVDLVIEVWVRWSAQLSTIRNMFFYLDRSYLLNSQHEASIWTTGLNLFRKLILEQTAVSTQFMASLMVYFEIYRSHKKVNVELITATVRMISALGVYSTLFHPQFIDSTQKHYAHLAAVKLGTIRISEYLVMAMDCLAFETEEAALFGLDKKTKGEAVQAVETELVGAKALDIIDGFDDLITAYDVKGLANMYDLLSQVGQTKLLVDALAYYIQTEGLKLVIDPAKDSVMVSSLLSFKDKIDQLAENAFKDDESLVIIIRKSFEIFINKRENVPAEMLAKYLDELLKVGNKEMEDNEMENKMDKVLVLFAFISGKDVFEAFYKKDLAKRLLLNKSASDDAERSMLARLKVECGNDFTQNLEGMFQDVEVSKDFVASFKNSKYSTSSSEGGIDLYVNALSQAFWPSYPDVKIILPQYMADALENFRTFYTTKQSNRRLSWRHSLGHCVVRADFPIAKKELSMSLFQTIVLLQFNDVPDGDTLTYESIRTATGLDDRELTRTLQSLACGKIRVLHKSPRGKDVNPGDKFKVNLKFEERAFRLRINQIQLKETPEENKDTHDQVMRDRQYEIQACVIRILKTKKTIKHVELIQQVIDQTKSRGTLDLADIKKNIEKLIEKDYMERQGSDTYIYVA